MGNKIIRTIANNRSTRQREPEDSQGMLIEVMVAAYESNDNHLDFNE